jgi:hypothetical protein
MRDPWLAEKIADEIFYAVEPDSMSREECAELAAEMLSTIDASGIAWVAPQWRREIHDGQKAWAPDVNALEQIAGKPGKLG